MQFLATLPTSVHHPSRTAPRPKGRGGWMDGWMDGRKSDCGSVLEPVPCYRKAAGSIPLFCISECPWARFDAAERSVRTWASVWR